MSLKVVTRSNGRLKYIEPNDLIDNVDGEIPYPYEDYCMSVNLSVEITNRYSCGFKGENGSYKRLDFSSNNGSISFLSGSKIGNLEEGYLTTNFTDISMESPVDNTGECLNIESITISYDKFLFPLVVIKFVDVRGATIMQPADYNYYQKEGNIKSNNLRDLYKSLFTIPYPIFTLNVKGYYGKGATFRIIPFKTAIEMDANNGNFNIIVSFAGDRYGIYENIPLVYLAAAPYMVEGDAYWKSKIADGTFKFRDAFGNKAQDMLKFPEFRLAIAKAASNERYVSAAARGQEIKSIRQDQINNLTKIQEANIFVGDGYGWFKNDKDYWIKLCRKKDELEKVHNDVVNFSQLVGNYRKNYDSSIPDFFGTMSGKSSSYYSLLFDSNMKLYEEEYKLDKDCSVKDVILKTKINDGLKKYIESYCEETVKEGIKVKEPIPHYLYCVKKVESDKWFYFVDNIEDKKIGLLEVIKEEERRFKEQELSLIEELVGFRPSVRNIYNLIFAHFDTFMHCFYETTKYIRTQIEENSKDRLKKTYQLGNEDTDTPPINVSNENDISNFLPPFAAYYSSVNNEEIKQSVWPENLFASKGTKGNGNLIELGFVKRLLSGAQQFTDDIVLASKELDEFKSGTTTVDITEMVKGFIPTTIYDYMYRDKISNPYYNVLDSYTNDDENIGDYILGIFEMRAFYHATSDDNIFSSTSDERKKARTFGALEAINLFKAIGDGNKSLNFLKFITTLSTYKPGLFENFIKLDKSCWSFDGKNKSFFTKTNEYRGVTSLYGMRNRQKAIKNLNFNLSNEDFLPICEFNCQNIKADFNNPTLLENNYKYLSTNIPDVITFDNYAIVSSATDSFILIPNQNYIKQISEASKLELERTKDCFNHIELEKNNEGGFKEWFEEWNNNQVKKNKYNFISNGFDTLNKFTEDNWYIKDDIVFDDEGNSYNRKKLAELISTENKEELGKYFIKYPIYFNNNFEKIYNLQLSIEAKAYLFLLGTPTKNIVSECSNGVVPRILLLKEGAYYWYLDNEDKVIWSEKCKKHRKNQFFTLSEYDDIINKISHIEYPEWNFPKGCTPSRMNTLKDLFVSWANSTDVENGFAANEHLFNNEILYDVYNSKPELDQYQEAYVATSIKKGLRTLKNIEEDENILDKAWILKDANDLQVFLRNLFFGLNTIFDLYSPGFKHTKETLSSVESLYLDAAQGFCSQISLIYGDLIKNTNGNTEKMQTILENAKISSELKSDDVNLSTYMTLKNLYDRWLCLAKNGSEDWKFNTSVNTPFTNFLFIDSFYRDIGDKLTLDISNIDNMLSKFMPNLNMETGQNMVNIKGASVMSFISEIAEKNSAMLLVIPQKINNYDEAKLEEMFKPYSLNSDWSSEGICYAFMYTYEPCKMLGDSEHKVLDMNGFNPDGDGIDLTKPDEVNAVFGGEGYNIPAFGVTYAKQNQSIFKNITLNNSDGIITDAAIAAKMNIVNTTSESPRAPILMGQDIYKVFSNYSYKCSVEMLGNAQILPTTYFQLNNVPFWKGAYQIYKVTHNISAGNFTTNFEGIKVSKHSIPLVDSKALILPETGYHAIDSKEPSSQKQTDNSDNKLNSKLFEETHSEIKHIEPNPKVTISSSDTMDFNEANISNTKPLICLTPAHGPKTRKSLEWEWSTKVVDRIVEILKGYKYNDGTPYNIQRCNKNGKHSNRTGYSMKETRTLIQKYGSKNVISIVPHWNGGGGQYHWTILNYKGSVRDDSKKLASCMATEVKNTRDSILSDEYYKKYKSGLVQSGVSGIIKVDFLPKTNTDGAPRVDCACILTENWFTDYNIAKNGGSKWQTGDINQFSDMMYSWFNDNDEKGGIEVIAQMHANAIKRYIDSLT